LNVLKCGAGEEWTRPFVQIMRRKELNRIKEELEILRKIK